MQIVTPPPVIRRVILPHTDHLTALKYTDSERHGRLHGRLLAASSVPISTTIVSVVEQMRGWFSFRVA